MTFYWNSLGVIGRLCSGIDALPGHLLYYSKTSMTQTWIPRFPWLIQTHIQSIGNSPNSSRKQIFREILDGFFQRQILSFKIGMSGQMGVWHK